MLGCLDHEGNTCFVFADYFAATNGERNFKLTLDKLADSSRVKVEGIAFSHFKVVLIEVVSVISDLSDLLTNLSILRIVIPGCKCGVLLRMRVCSIKDSSIDNLFMLRLASYVAL